MFFVVTAGAFFLSILFTMLGLKLSKKFPDGVPFVILTVLYLIEFAVFTAIISAIGILSGGLLVALGFCIALPPFAVLGSQISQIFGNLLTDALYGGTLVTKAPKSYGKAKTLFVNGNTDGAVAAYKAYFEEDPTVPEPLYQAATILIREGRLHDAAALYRQIINRNTGDIQVWAKAVFTLAQLLELQIRDVEAANILYGQLISKAGNTEAGRLAANRQLQRAASAQPLNG